MRTRFATTVRTAICALLALLLFSSSAMAQVTPTVSPTTGLQTDKPYRPVLVVMSNAEAARPPWGIADADIVFESLYWGPIHTRYFALYNDTHPEKSGSVRGARVFNVGFAMAWDAMLVHFGGQAEKGSSIYDFMDEQGFSKDRSIDGTRGNGAYYKRMEMRVSPHNAVANIAKVVEEAWPIDEETGKAYEPSTPVMEFSQSPTKGDIAISSLHVVYEDMQYKASYEYDADEKLYQRYYCGVMQTDAESGAPVRVANVIVQQNEQYEYAGSPSRVMIETTGEGPIYAFIDGTMIKGKWIRGDEAYPIQYRTEEGKYIAFRPGQTFIQIVPPEMFEAMALNEQQETVSFYNVFKANPEGASI